MFCKPCAGGRNGHIICYPIDSSLKALLSSLKFVVGKPNVLDKDRFIARLLEIIDNEVHTNDGPFVRELEGALANYLGVPHCVAVANATLGLELVLNALPRRGQVIVPSFTFIASAHAIVRTGHTPVFVDVDSRGLIDPQAVAAAVGPETVAILPVNLFGLVCDVERLSDIASSAGARLIYDSAHALGVRSNGKNVGGFGWAEVFSLHATKVVSGFEGGFVTTSDGELARVLREARNFGFDKKGVIVALGTNAKMSEVHAAMALTNLEKIDWIIEHNAANFCVYQSELSELCALIEPQEGESSNYQYVPVIVATSDLRDKVFAKLIAKGIAAKIYFSPGVHSTVPYIRNNICRSHDLSRTIDISSRIICLPTGVHVDASGVRAIAQIFNEALL